MFWNLEQEEIVCRWRRYSDCGEQNRNTEEIRTALSSLPQSLKMHFICTHTSTMYHAHTCIQYTHANTNTNVCVHTHTHTHTKKGGVGRERARKGGKE